MPRISALCVVLLVGLETARAGDDEFVPLFNGTDLTGWVNVNCAPGTFFVKDKMIITTGIPTGYLRTTKPYENFIAEFEWFHAPPKKGAVGNSGFFVWADPIPAVGTGYTRGIEVQVLVNLTWTDKKSGKETATSQGDLFSIWGAKCRPDRPHPLGWERCLPSENRQKGEFEWNHFRVEANNGVIKLAVNGKVVSGISECNPRKGYLALESEGSECRFKNLKIKELPSTNPKPSECAEVDQGFKSLLTGVDLSGWKGTDEQKAYWKIDDGVLINQGEAKKKPYYFDSRLTSEKEFGNFEMVFDWRYHKDPAQDSAWTTIQILGGQAHVSIGVLENTKVCSVGTNSGTIMADPNRKIELKPAGEWNRFLVRMKGDRITVRCNGKLVFENQQIQRLNSLRGEIVLDCDKTLRTRNMFRNIFIRELKGDE